MKKYSKLIVAAIVALIFIGTFVFLYEKSQPKPVEYTEFTPKMADVLKTTVITGKIEPRNEVSVKPQISGIITEICKEAGIGRREEPEVLGRIQRVEGDHRTKEDRQRSVEKVIIDNIQKVVSSKNGRPSVL